MGQILHGSARTTEAARRAIQHSQESLRALSKRHGVNPWALRGAPFGDGGLLSGYQVVGALLASSVRAGEFREGVSQEAIDRGAMRLPGCQMGAGNVAPLHVRTGKRATLCPPEML